jgi:hypothetical protein
MGKTLMSLGDTAELARLLLIEKRRTGTLARALMEMSYAIDELTAQHGTDTTADIVLRMTKARHMFSDLERNG